MSAYIDEGEKFVARLGGEYAPGVKKAAKSLELTDRRIYFSTVGVSVGTDGKGESMASSVIDAANVSAVSYIYEKPKGGFGLGTFLLVMAALAGVIFGVVGYVGDETKAIIKLILPICIAVGVGIVALVLCYVITLLIRKSHRAVTVSIEYRGLILRTDFYGIKDDKLEDFRRWTFRVKDRLLGRKAPPLPETATKADFGDVKEAKAEPVKEQKTEEVKKEEAKKEEPKKEEQKKEEPKKEVKTEQKAVPPENKESEAKEAAAQTVEVVTPVKVKTVKK